MKSRKIWMLVLLIALAFALALSSCDINLGGDPDDPGTTKQKAATPTANKVTGTYAAGTKVTLTSTDSDVVIYYTLDGSTPTTSNYKYPDDAAADGIELTATVTPAVITLKAIATGEEKNNSDVLTVVFKVMPAPTAPATTVTVASSADTGAGSLRAAIEGAVNGTIIIIDPSVKKIELATNLVVKKTGVVIEGNGVVLTQATSFAAAQSLLQINGTFSATVSRVHFNKGVDLGVGDSGNGGAIYNIGSLTLESCIFSYNSAIRGGAIYNTPGGTGITLTVKGCTFFANSTKNATTTSGGTNSNINKGAGGAIYNEGGKISFTGNLFYQNTAEGVVNPGTGNNASTTGFVAPIVFNTNNGSVDNKSYNVTDIGFGTADGKAGWSNDNQQSNKTFVNNSIDATLDLDEGVVPINTTTFVPISDLKNFIPSSVTDFPKVDFNGELRTTGVPGAVNAN